MLSTVSIAFGYKVKITAIRLSNTWQRVCRRWYDVRADIEIKELIDPNARINDAVAYTYISILRGRKSGCEFSARVFCIVC